MPIGILVPAANLKPTAFIWLSQKHTFEVVLLRQITPSSFTLSRMLFV